MLLEHYYMEHDIHSFSSSFYLWNGSGHGRRTDDGMSTDMEGMNNGNEWCGTDPIVFGLYGILCNW